MNESRQTQAAFLLLCTLLLGACAGCEKREELTRVDSEKEANRILVELAERGIPDAGTEEKAAQRKTAYAITVPKEQLIKARAILVQCDLPRDSHGGFNTLVEGGGLIPTKTEERAKLMYAMAGELERTLETIDRVVSARVHIVLPERDVMQRDTKGRPTPSAMVLIKYTPVAPAAATGTKSGKSASRAPVDAATTAPSALPAEFPDAPVRPEEVQQMVSKSVEGLTPEDVFVTYTRSVGRQVPEPAAATAAAAASPAPSSGEGRPLMLQLFAATAVFGLAAMVMTALLVREKRRNRAALALAPR